MTIFSRSASGSLYISMNANATRIPGLRKKVTKALANSPAEDLPDVFTATSALCLGSRNMS